MTTEFRFVGSNTNPPSNGILYYQCTLTLDMKKSEEEKRMTPYK